MASPPLPIFGATLTTTLTTTIPISPHQASFTFYYPPPTPTTLLTSYTTLVPIPDSPVTSLPILVLTEIVGIAVSSGTPIATRTLIQPIPSQGDFIRIGEGNSMVGVVGGGCPKWIWSCQTQGQKIGTGFAIALAAIAFGFFAWWMWFWCCGDKGKKKSFVVVRRGGGPPVRDVEKGVAGMEGDGDGLGLLLGDLPPEEGGSLKRSQRTRKKKKSVGNGREEDDARGGLLIRTEPQMGGGWSRGDAGPARSAERSLSQTPRRKLSKRNSNNAAAASSHPMRGEVPATAQMPNLPPPSSSRKLSRSSSAKRPKTAPIVAQGDPTTAEIQQPPPQTRPPAPEQALPTPTSRTAVVGTLIGAAATSILDQKPSQQPPSQNQSAPSQQPTRNPSQKQSASSQQPTRNPSQNQSAPSQQPTTRNPSQNQSLPSQLPTQTNPQRPPIAVRTENTSVKHAHFVDSPPAIYSDRAIWRSDSNRESQRRIDEKRQREARRRDESERPPRRGNRDRNSLTSEDEIDAPPPHHRHRHRHRGYRNHSPPPPQVHPRAHSKWMALLPLALAALYELAGSKTDLLQQMPRAQPLVPQQAPPSRSHRRRRESETETETHPLNQYAPPPPNTKNPDPDPERDQTQDKEEERGRARGTEPRSTDVRIEENPTTKERAFSFSPSPERGPPQRRRRVSRRDVRKRGENTEA